MKPYQHVITAVAPGSIGEEMGLEPGDIVAAVNGTAIEDVFDYQFLTEDEYLEMQILTKDGEEVLLEIEKEEDEDLGLTFESGLMSDYRSCHNKCVFCFIDQMPPGMRETLYFKDDDSRLSFLQGNYITMTNMSEKDIDRIIRYHLSPINISVHATDPELRVKLLHNKHAGKILEHIRRLYEAETVMNGQIVLCRGLNDAEQLDRTIGDLAAFLPWMRSLSVVPVGITRFRKGLYPLEPIDRETALDTVRRVEAWQEKLYAEWGTHFVHCSDELYILAGLPLPEAERYDGYLQLENGVGMLRSLTDETDAYLKTCRPDGRRHTVSLATGALAGPYIREIADRVRALYPGIDAKIYPIRNDFFGETITVSGLITGGDLVNQLKGRELGCALLLPANMLKSDEAVFLDDMTLAGAQEALGVPVRIVGASGEDLVRAIAEPLAESGEHLRMDIEAERRKAPLHNPYELHSL